MNEPATVVGDSGKAYARVNDRTDGQPEQITVTPPAGAPPNPGDGGGPGVSMASGGIFNRLQNIPGDNMATGYDDQEMLRLREQARQQQQGIFANTNQYLNSRRQGFDAQGNVITAQRNQIPLDRNVLLGEQGVIRARGNQINSQRDVLGAQQRELGGTRGVITLQQQQNAAKNADVMRIRNAGANVADKAAVAMESLYRGTEDALIYSKLGVAPPPTIGVQGADPTGLPPGMRAELKTQEQLVSEVAQMNEQDRASTLESARLAVQLLGTDTEAARLKAAEVGLTVEEAQNLVAGLRNTASMGELGVTEARLNASAADLNSSRISNAGDFLDLGLKQTQTSLGDMKSGLEDSGKELYTDPVTGKRSVLTKYEADQRRYAYETKLQRERIPTAYETNLQRTGYGNTVRQYSGYNEEAFQDMILNSYPVQSNGNPYTGRVSTDIIAELMARNGGNEELARYQYGLLVQEVLKKKALNEAKNGAGLPPVQTNTTPGG